jgi:hypothetical protein
MEYPHERTIIQYNSLLFQMGKKIFSEKKGLANFFFDKITLRKNFEKVPYVENLFRDRETNLYMTYSFCDLRGPIKAFSGDHGPSEIEEKISLVSFNKKKLTNREANSFASRIEEDFEKMKKMYPESAVDLELIKKIEKEIAELPKTDIFAMGYR